MGPARQPVRAGAAARLAACFLAFASLALPPQAGAQQRALTWSAGQPSGGWYEQATGLAALVKAKTGRLDIKPVAGAAYGNMTKLQQGETDLAWSLPPVITAAYNGDEPFKGRQADIRLVMTGLGFVQTHFCIAEDTGIGSVREIFGKKLALRIGSPRPGGSDEWELRNLMAFYRTSYADLKGRGGEVVFGAFAELAAQFRDRKIDAFVLNNAVPAGDIVEASRGRKLRILPMDEDLVRHLATFGLVSAVIPRGSYKEVVNNDGDIPSAAMANTIVTSAAVPPEAVHDFTAALLGNLAALRKVHPAFGDFDPRTAAKLANVPLHPGAEQAYREAGLLQ
jgi:TRAP transporter TAXI family solute receptor